MAVYTYSVSDSATGLIRGTITADSPRQARDQLRLQGLAVHDLAEHQPGRVGGLVRWWPARRHASEVTTLYQEMATLLTAGLPLLQALDTIIRQHTGSFQRSIMLLRDRVAAGSGLAEAMADHPYLFDGLSLNIVEVGENAGTLETALSRLVAFRRRSERLKNKVATALMYPAIVMMVGLGVSAFLMTFVTPNLLSVLVESGRELPLATWVVKGVSDFLLGWWWALMLAVALLVGAASATLKTATGRLKWHRAQLTVPLLGELVRKQAIARMSLVMATLLKSDVPFVTAVQIAQRTVRNEVLRGALVACERAVGAGRDIAVALEGTKAFPPLVIQVFAVGQASGRLEQMLEDLASDYDTQVEASSTRLTALLEPIMMILLAITVGFIAFATILPILEAGRVL